MCSIVAMSTMFASVVHTAMLATHAMNAMNALYIIIVMDAADANVVFIAMNISL